MEERLRAFAKPTGAPLDRAAVWQPPEMSDDFTARLLALVVEQMGGEVSVTRDEVRELPRRLMLLVTELHESLRVDTRRLATEQPTSD